MSTDEEQEYPEDILYFAENTEPFEKSAGTIEKVIESTKANESIGRDDLINRIKWAISVETEVDDEFANQLSNSFVTILINFNSQTKQYLEENDVGENIIKSIKNLAINHRDYIASLVLEEGQGNRFWKSLDTEQAIRDGKYGFTHYITYGSNGDEVVLTTSSNSLLKLAAHLIRNQTRLIDEVKGSAAEQIDTQAIQEFGEESVGLLQSLSEHREDIDFKGGMDTEMIEEKIDEIDSLFEEEGGNNNDG